MSLVVVIGGGIVGASAAYHLSQQGAVVIIVDPVREGAATDASAGVISPVGAQPRPAADYLFRATSYYCDLVSELAKLGYQDHGYRPVGELLVATGPEEEASLAPRYEWAGRLVSQHGQRGVGRPERLDAATARAKCPLLGPVVGALFLPEVAQVDGARFRDCLLAAAQERGATLVRQPGSLRTEGRRVTGVAVPGRVLDADQVVLAAGAWSGKLAEPAGVHLPVYPQRGQIAHATLPTQPTVPHLPVAAGFRSHYLLQAPNGQIVFGATHEDDAGFAHTLTVGGIAELVTEVARLAPGLAQAHWGGARVGFRPATPDGAPLLGRTAQLSRLLIGTGFGSIGLTIGAYAGAQLAALALGEEVDIPDAFHPDRFGQPDRYLLT